MHKALWAELFPRVFRLSTAGCYRPLSAPISIIGLLNKLLLRESERSLWILDRAVVAFRFITRVAYCMFSSQGGFKSDVTFQAGGSRCMWVTKRMRRRAAGRPAGRSDGRQCVQPALIHPAYLTAELSMQRPSDSPGVKPSLKAATYWETYLSIVIKCASAYTLRTHTHTRKHARRQVLSREAVLLSSGGLF